MAIFKQGAAAVLPEYRMENLGTSFQVILENSVRRIDNSKTDYVYIPDQQGLYKKISHKRALDPRKLTGEDIRFLRRTLDMKAKDLASLLDISPEYLSRCEAGEKVMASNAEKMLRLNVLLEPFYMIKASEEAAGDLKYTFERLLSQMAEIRRVVQEMKIVTAADVAEAIVYRFCRKKRPALATGSELAPANDDDDGCEWLKVA